MSDALVLAGGVAKGAFGAGACAVLFNELPCLNVTRVVATSSGALNAAFLSPAIRGGAAGDAAYDHESLWLDHASFGDVFRPSLAGLAKLDGFSSSRCASSSRATCALRRRAGPWSSASS